MTITFQGQTTTQFGGGDGGQPFADVLDAPQVLVGVLYDCNAFTPDGDDYPTWTIYYKFLRAVVPYFAPLNADGTIGASVRGSQHGGAGGQFVASGLLMAPPGYVVTAINVRGDSMQASGGTFAKAFQLGFAQWTPAGISTSVTSLSPWQGGDGQLSSNGPSAYGPGDINAVPNAPAVSTSGSTIALGAGPGGCFVGLSGRNGDVIDALGGIWAVPQIGG